MIIPENINILIVDDIELVLIAYENVLSKQGYHVFTATNGKNALQIIGQEKISLVLLDVLLPDQSGLEIMRLIKSNPETEDIFVVLISAMAISSENQIEGMELGADGYLVKPMPSWELALRVSGFLKHKRTIDLLKISKEKYRRISEKTEEALKESNAYLCALLENNSNILIAMDKDYKIQFANRPAIEMTKLIYGKELELGKSILEIINNDRVEQCKNHFNSALNGKPVYVEQYYVIKDRAPMWFGIQYSNSTDDLNNTLGVFIIITDITKRKETEALVLMYQTELEHEVEERTSELVSLNEGLRREINERKYAEQELQKLSKVVEQAADHVIITDKNGIIEYVNPAFEAGTGYSKEEAIGLTPRILKSGNNNPDFAKELWKTILSKRTFRGVSINKKKNGTLYYEEMTVTPLLDANNNITHLVSVGRDITERRQAEADRNAREAADLANKTKSLFLANMSHEIRTPMNAIIGFSDLLYASVIDEKQRSQLDAIRSSGKNLLRIINDILDLSKIEAGKMVIQYECINIHNIIKEIETIFVHVTKEKGIAFIIDTAEDIPFELLLDETRIRQILFNIIGNAVKFTDKGEVTLSVTQKNKRENKIDLIIAVKDTGIGIPANQLNLIFEAFTQQMGQRAGQYGGTGLGLTITKRLVEMMGGNIQISSESGKGSIFTINIPDVIVNGKGKKEPEINSSDLSSLLFEEGTVLIADDNQENRKYLVDLLSHNPLTLIEAENGIEAIEKAQIYLPDVILMDCKMPVMNGGEAIDILKKQITTKAIPIIALSASSREVIEEQNGAVYFDDFLMKPINAVELLELLKKYLKFHINSKSTHSESENSPDLSLILTKVQKNQLPRLVYILENEYAPIYYDVAKKQVVGQIKSFGDQLFALGEDYSNPIITDFGKELSAYANNFEISKMMKKLKTFPEIIDKLKKLIKE
ncbi:MAG: response regulator [Bacteroidia bacterium]|nr:response regulator [Bacteroidia bacterium]